MKSIIKVLLFIMIISACFNVVYNSVKTISEVKEWTPLSDTQKRHKIFGDLYDFLILVKTYTKNDDHILIYAKDGEKYQTYFLSIYYLYPRRITSTVDNNEFIQVAKNKK